MTKRRETSRRAALLFGAVSVLLGAALAGPPAAAQDVPRRDVAETFGLCTSCHKADGRGGPGYGGFAANLRTTPLTAEEIVEVLTDGRQDRGMPPFSELLEPEEMADLATYILVELRDEPEAEGEAAADAAE